MDSKIVVVARADSVGVVTVGHGRAEAGARYCVVAGPNSHVRFGVVRDGRLVPASSPED